jgi:hypothetical protein
MIDIDTYKKQLISIFDLIQNKYREYGGVIKEDGFTCFKGEHRSVEADFFEKFTWHYHPNGVLKFSNNDYFCFMASDAQISALFTKNQVAIYEKTDIESSFKAHLFQELTGFQCLKGLFYMKSLKTFNEYFNCDLNEDSEQELLIKLNVSKTIYKRDLQKL